MKYINKHIDIVSGITWIIVAIIGLVLSAQIVQRASTQGTVGPAFIPKVVCILIMISGVAVLIGGIYGVKNGNAELGCFPEEKKEIVAVIVTILACIVYSLIVEPLGFVIASALFLIFQISYFDLDWKKHLIRTIAISVPTAVVVFAIFRYGFSLTLPTGNIF